MRQPGTLSKSHASAGIEKLGINFSSCWLEGDEPRSPLTTGFELDGLIFLFFKKNSTPPSSLLTMKDLINKDRQMNSARIRGNGP